jgi:predicted nucleic acid-binding Zn ribbon protein
MGLRNTIEEIPRFCIMCKGPIPPTRNWSSVTCSKECSTRRADFWRNRQDMTQCRYCQKPSTPEERTRYLLWRRWEKAGVGDEKSAQNLLRENARLKCKLAELQDESANDEQEKTGEEGS